ncbi:hypothetical protein OBO34_19370 [Clostridiales Family XIII bacterium ASD5510]|uniref:Uncharacterized protein n=1 Tax=Hominibacterium faecale TaxID=2839743 RepID=A0A9J6QYB5_9FIRM|nr:hypothetical protein [Hominibacterium faecale]MCU7380476.1 hypothetical protein [Hominibacterium faecale]
MYLIRISTELKLTVHDFPEGSYNEQNEVLRRLIGNGCELYEHVMPKRLYTVLKHSNCPTNIQGQAISMLVDEEGLLKEKKKMNPIASYLYETDKHGYPIVGNVLFIGEVQTADGINFCGIGEAVFEKLREQLQELIDKFKAAKMEKE